MNSISNMNTTTFRPPYTPVSFGALAGYNRKKLFSPTQLTNLHRNHQKRGAKFEIVGQWLRPHYFPNNNENMDEAVKRESLESRNKIAMMDSSTLGKIDIQGKDVRKFLDRVYTNKLG